MAVQTRIDWGLKAAAFLLIRQPLSARHCRIPMVVCGAGEVDSVDDDWRSNGVGPRHFERVDQRHEVSAKQRGHCLPQAPGERAEFLS
jgi:hypothetical protein